MIDVTNHVVDCALPIAKSEGLRVLVEDSPLHGLPIFGAVAVNSDPCIETELCSRCIDDIVLVAAARIVKDPHLISIKPWHSQRLPLSNEALEPLIVIDRNTVRLVDFSGCPVARILHGSKLVELLLERQVLSLPVVVRSHELRQVCDSRCSCFPHILIQINYCPLLFPS